MTGTTGRRVFDFEPLFRRGLGRAVLYLGANDARPHRDVLLHGCAHNIAYDRQCEDSRPEYLCDVITIGAHLSVARC